MSKPAWVASGGGFSASFTPMYSDFEDITSMDGSSIRIAAHDSIIGFELEICAPDGAKDVFRSRGDNFWEMTAGSSGAGMALKQLIEAANGGPLASTPSPVIPGHDPGDDCPACIEMFGEQGLCPDSCAACGGLHCPAIECEADVD